MTMPLPPVHLPRDLTRCAQKMAQSDSVRYEKLRNAEGESGDEQENEQEEEDQVTVYLYSCGQMRRRLRSDRKPRETRRLPFVPVNGVLKISRQTQPSGPLHNRQWRRELWLRVAMAAVLLTVALGFVICEQYGCLSTDMNQEHHSHPSESKQGLGHLQHDGQAADSHSSKETEVYDHHGDPRHHSHEHTSSQNHHGVVITDATVCSEAGREILEDGGNVVDAGMASLLCLGVVHPHTAGVGGVFSGIFYNSTTGLSRGIRPTCKGSSLSTYSFPATLQGVGKMHSEFGSSKWEKLFVKAIKLAKEGFLADDALALALKSNELRIEQSELRDLFYDTNGSMKTSGSQVINEKLSELLQCISVNRSLLPEILSMKLALDLPFVTQDHLKENIQCCGIEIGDPFTIEDQQFTVLLAASSLPSTILSDMLERSRAQSSIDNYSNLLNTAKLVYNKSLENQTLGGLSGSNMVGSHIGVLDNSGNILIISTSLNSLFGSTQFLPSSGVILSDFVLYPAVDLSQWSCPSIIKVRHPKNDDEDDGEDVFGVGVTGGFSAPFIAAQIIINKLHLGRSVLEAVSGPLLHVAMKSPQVWWACTSLVSNATDVYKLLLEEQGQVQAMGECADGTVALVVEKCAGHVGAYGAPAAKAHTDGY
ncbi:gamma-glutamyltransferase 6 [Arapaima gigas]